MARWCSGPDQRERERAMAKKKADGAPMDKHDAAPLNGCWGCECGADLIDAMHEEPTDIPGKVYFYPCKSNVCLPPSRSFAQRTFDIDLYSCPCGHPYASHDYGRHANGDMRINKCLDCEAANAAGTGRRCAMRANRERGEHGTENTGSCSGPNGDRDAAVQYLIPSTAGANDAGSS